MSDDIKVIPALNMGSVGLPGRTFERKQGCYNCAHHDTGEEADKYYLARRKIDAKILLTKYLDEEKDLPPRPDDGSDRWTAFELAQLPMLERGDQQPGDDKQRWKLNLTQVADKVERHLARQDEVMRPPLAGICRAGKSQGEFSQLIYLCDGWSGRGGLRVDGRMDDLAAELKDKLGDDS